MFFLLSCIFSWIYILVYCDFLCLWISFTDTDYKLKFPLRRKKPIFSLCSSSHLRCSHIPFLHTSFFCWFSFSSKNTSYSSTIYSRTKQHVIHIITGSPTFKRAFLVIIYHSFSLLTIIVIIITITSLPCFLFLFSFLQHRIDNKNLKIKD